MARAIALLKARDAEPLRLDAPAAAAHMSPSSLHARFKAATAMSPLQFQEAVAAARARRTMLVESLEVAFIAACFRMGLGNPSSALLARVRGGQVS